MNAGPCTRTGTHTNAFAYRCKHRHTQAKARAQCCDDDGVAGKGGGKVRPLTPSCRRGSHRPDRLGPYSRSGLRHCWEAGPGGTSCHRPEWCSRWPGSICKANRRHRVSTKVQSYYQSVSGAQRCGPQRHGGWSDGVATCPGKDVQFFPTPGSRKWSMKFLDG